jgi:hypothetical protein
MPEQSASPPNPLPPWAQAVIALVQGLLPAMTGIIGGLWLAFTYVENQKALAEKEMATRLKESQVRLFEAQKPFLDKKLQIFFEADTLAGQMINDKPNSPEWNQHWQRFWSLRWAGRRYLTMRRLAWISMRPGRATFQLESMICGIAFKPSGPRKTPALRLA